VQVKAVLGGSVAASLAAAITPPDPAAVTLALQVHAHTLIKSTPTAPHRL
jgi:hypothetical protein